MSAAISSLDLSTPTAATPAAPPTTADAIGSDKLGKNEFLKLLMAQLGNQDPLAPTDNQAFVAQLAQFAGLEAAQGTNSRLDTLLMAEASSNQTAAVSFIGKNVDYHTDALNLQAGLSATSQATLAAKADKVTVHILDSTNRVVRTLALGAQPGGPMAVVWDGNDDGGVRQPPGAYHIDVAATGADGKSVAAALQTTGEATGVVFDNGVPQLRINGTLVPMSAVMSINERNAP